MEVKKILYTEKFYINGKMYVPSESTILCDVQIDSGYMSLEPTTRSTLFMTQKGAFFLVSEVKGYTEVKVLSREEALEFMDQNAAYIDTDLYDQVFGVPEEG